MARRQRRLLPRARSRRRSHEYVNEYLGTLNKSLRYDVRRLDKDLFTSGNAVIREATQETLSEDLEIFFDNIDMEMSGLSDARRGKYDDA